MLITQPLSAGQSSEQRYHHLFENMPICIFVTDLAVAPAVILEANRRAGLVFGYSPAELIGMPAAQLVPEASRPAVQSIMQRVQSGQTVTEVVACQRRDCTVFPVRVSATPDPADAAHMIVTVEDITTDVQRRSEAEAIDAERLRIAHEIHDGVAQNLAGLRFKSALWRYLAESAPPGMQQALQELQDVLAGAIADIRRSIFALRPIDLESMGLFPALKQLVSDFGDQNQLATTLELSDPMARLPQAYELPLFRMIQESLNNISLHAQASAVQVRLVVGPGGEAVAHVRDNGIGFDPSRIGPAEHTGHFGLRQMRERALDLGGSLDILSAPGRGTELIVNLPPMAIAESYAAD